MSSLSGDKGDTGPKRKNQLDQGVVGEWVGVCVCRGCTVDVLTYYSVLAWAFLPFPVFRS